MDDSMFTDLWVELSGALYELIDIIEDPAWQADMKSRIAILETRHIDREMWEEYYKEYHTYF